ncbi:hypothetical protein M422DRAFT_272975 [Sphaerobolus stellatus SS14]|uniref:Uncharacterized protein n=1 Tax=Sphaerobolus stellatus (strain SS14) TaxID=990650 RepID=A0A0C9UAB9_SPHS4|nr:hypothetical protein M422DRAFT_272975 [Sphaerobolus stellatus SS14]
MEEGFLLPSYGDAFLAFVWPFFLLATRCLYCMRTVVDEDADPVQLKKRADSSFLGTAHVYSGVSVTLLSLDIYFFTLLQMHQQPVNIVEPDYSVLSQPARIGWFYYMQRQIHAGCRIVVLGVYADLLSKNPKLSFSALYPHRPCCHQIKLPEYGSHMKLSFPASARQAFGEL